MTDIEKLQSQVAAALLLVKLAFKMNPELQATVRAALPDLQGILLPLPLRDDQLSEYSQLIAEALEPLPERT